MNTNFIGRSKICNPQARRRPNLAFAIGAFMTAACTGSMDASDDVDIHASSIQLGQSESGFLAVGDVLTVGGGGGIGCTGNICPQLDATSGTCTGVLVSPSYVLTANHCAPLTSFRIGTSPADFVTYRIDSWVLHPTRDLLIAHLVTPVPGVAPLPYNVGSLPPVGSICTAVGFGIHNESNGQVTVDRKRSCTESIQSVNASDITVAMVSGIADHGDSGGPLLCNGVIAGVVRDHIGDGEFPSHTHEAYTTVDAEWIRNNLPHTSDILWRNVTTGQFAEWIMGNGTVASTINLFTEPAEWQVQGTGDFNDDGTSDILWRNVTTGQFTEWIMGNGTVASTIDLFAEPAEWQVQGIGDFNGDGTSDILWRNVTTGQVTEWIMGNGTVASTINLFAEPAEWQVQGIGDFNGDKTSDILWRNVNTGQIAEWIMRGGTVASAINLFAEPAEWQVQGIGDFDGDGDSDILWRNVSTGQLTEWMMAGGTVASTIDLFAEPAEWQVQRIGDFNGDGTGDVLWRNVNTGQITEWIMGKGTVASTIDLFAEPAEWQVQGIGDFDGR